MCEYRLTLISSAMALTSTIDCIYEGVGVDAIMGEVSSSLSMATCLSELTLCDIGPPSESAMGSLTQLKPTYIAVVSHNAK